jgi:hypothetical protein
VYQQSSNLVLVESKVKVKNTKSSFFYEKKNQVTVAEIELIFFKTRNKLSDRMTE